MEGEGAVEADGSGGGEGFDDVGGAVVFFGVGGIVQCEFGVKWCGCGDGRPAATGWGPSGWVWNVVRRLGHRKSWQERATA